MDLTTMISNFPSWGIVVLLILILFVLVIALRSGREISIWPPKIGAKIDVVGLQEQIKVLEARLIQEKERRESVVHRFRKTEQRTG
jgi:hypothetical protein